MGSGRNGHVRIRPRSLLNRQDSSTARKPTSGFVHGRKKEKLISAYLATARGIRLRGRVKLEYYWILFYLIKTDLEEN